MVFEVTFDQERKPLCKDLDTAQEGIGCLKSAAVLSDKIIIVANGRNAHAGHFRNNICYRVYDYIDTDTPKRFNIIIVYANGRPISVTTKGTYEGLKSYKTKRPLSELVDALIEVDRQYTNREGVIFCDIKLHETPLMIKKLYDHIEKIKAPT